MKQRIIKQLHSFYYAFRGLLSVLQTESHMRFHIVAALYVIFFGVKFYNLSTAQWAALILTITSVLICEIFNTVLERMCDTVTTEYNKNIEFIKDVSAGAVLVSAIGSVVIAFLLLFRVDIFRYILYYYSTHLFSLIIFIFVTALAVSFVVIKPETYLYYFRKNNKTEESSSKD